MWESCARTHCGNRRANNEDSVLDHPDAALWVVADGMGGHMAGDVASQAIVDALARIPAHQDLDVLIDRVEDTLLNVNDDLRTKAREAGAGTTIGSTVVVMAAAGDVGVALWAGDSRLYRLRAQRVELITRDHNPVSDLMDDGLVTESVVLRTDTNVVTRAIGGHANLSLDIALFDIQSDDTFLLCSDGLYREINDEEMVGLLQDTEVSNAVDQLIEACLAGEARDNVSVIVSRPDGPLGE
ncbi:MAG: serine/threonine-protein phosphatase [Gammaproteobacteria bacterium]|nr:serine/threonine-protein phosphatase [Gammaproteobacteria bacterium]